MCHFLISYPLNVYVSCPDMMQGDKGNIKGNLGITLVWQLIRFYHFVIVFCLCSNMALYNIPIGFKIFAIINLHQRNETFTRFTHL